MASITSTTDDLDYGLVMMDAQGRRCGGVDVRSDEGLCFELHPVDWLAKNVGCDFRTVRMRRYL